jgi:acetyl esterase/lipase
MPIGYLVTTGLLAIFVLSAVARRRPRESRPFRLSYVFGLWFNWPLVVFVFLVASTALAIAQSGVGSPVFWIGLCFAVAATAGLVVLRRRARAIGPVIERAMDAGLGSGWRDRVDAEHVARPRDRSPLARLPLASLPFRRRGVERIANIRYGPAGRGNLLDLYRRRSDPPDGPTLIYFHWGAFGFGTKSFGARHFLRRLADQGWVCLSANYRSTFPDPLVDVKKVIAWVREHGREYGADPSAVFLAGSSAGGHLALTAALTPNDPAFQPGFEGTDTSVAGAISLYAYYGPISSGEEPSSPAAYVNAKAPPCFVIHGDQDTLVIVDDARRFVERLRGTSSSPVVYAELPGTQHGFDLLPSLRVETALRAIEAFAAFVRSTAARPRSGGPQLSRSAAGRGAWSHRGSPGTAGSSPGPLLGPPRSDRPR